MTTPGIASRDTNTVLATIPDPAQRVLLESYLDGRLSAEMTLMYWMKKTPDVDAISDSLDTVCRVAAGAGVGTRRAMRALSTLLDLNYPGCRRIAAMLSSGMDSDLPASSVDEGIAHCRRLFDWSVDQSPESSVALYSLGSAHILDAATEEIVALLRHGNLLGRRRDVLEIGCGTGRFQIALSTLVRTVCGIDVSARMIAAARERCAGLANVFLQECSGRDLGLFADRSVDLALAVDSFPYLVQSGMALVERHFSEARRVLRPGGDFAIFEFSYRGDIGLDRADIERMARAFGFDIDHTPHRPFKIWGGTVFHLKRGD